MAKKAKAGMLKIQYVRSAIGNAKKKRLVLRSIGLTRLGQIVERVDTPAVRGMVKKIPHLVRVVSE